MVVDADALFALAEQPEVLSAPGGPRVLTPHPGEFERLTGKPYDEAERIEAAAEFARARMICIGRSGAVRREQWFKCCGKRTPRNVVVLKGHRTVVTDGTRVSVNQTGNPGMATGGSGDVLTGVITGLLCQGLVAVRCGAAGRACARPGGRSGGRPNLGKCR